MSRPWHEEAVRFLEIVVRTRGATGAEALSHELLRAALAERDQLRNERTILRSLLQSMLAYKDARTAGGPKDSAFVEDWLCQVRAALEEPPAGGER